MSTTMTVEQGLQEIERSRIVVIIRGVGTEEIVPLADALYRGGITVMEVTMNTPGALDMIRTLQQQFGDRIFIGAGTVLDARDAEQAIEAGASFLVTPNVDVESIQYAQGRGIPIYPGAMTPTEIVTAWKAGASAVKIFPGASLGIGYLRELQGPLSHIPMVAVGGIHEDNIQQYLQICAAVGIGGSLVSLKDIAAGNFQAITEKAARLTAKVQELSLHQR
jgi:2-dehydro-3-deoxyphosphogluconate aldolase / (4S)-4-hydroxy-2-oxoglutarate aldolase